MLRGGPRLRNPASEAGPSIHLLFSTRPWSYPGPERHGYGEVLLPLEKFFPKHHPGCSSRQHRPTSALSCFSPHSLFNLHGGLQKEVREGVAKWKSKCAVTLISELMTHHCFVLFCLLGAIKSSWHSKREGSIRSETLADTARAPSPRWNNTQTLHSFLTRVQQSWEGPVPCFKQY